MSLEELRLHAREIFAAGLKSVDPQAAVKRFLYADSRRLYLGDRYYDLTKLRKIYVVGCGKAAAAMGFAVENILGDRIAGGVVVVKYGHGLALSKIEVVEAGHPVPDEAGLRGAARVTEFLQRAGEPDLVLFLLSGGASALLPCPAEGLTLVDKQLTTQLLLKSGATIREINAVRKHLSKLKGGRVAQLAAPARIATLAISDVVGDSLEDIGSGPTVADSSTYAQSLEILRRYSLQQEIPAAVLQHLERGIRGEIDETPKPSNVIFQKVQNIIVGTNRQALEAAKLRAESLGYNTLIFSHSVEGESRRVAAEHTEFVRRIKSNLGPISRPACVLLGGETTVTIKGDGVGGRNQEYALAAALEIDGIDEVVVLSAGTDGTDGPTDAAGGIVDGLTIHRAKDKGFDAPKYLDRNDSYHLLQATGDLFQTGPTLTNVMDMQVLLVL
ncbi:MAG TPA: glycerate kinase [Verrucomicrobiae bacterium]|nr:glycerate kinase [Verrucomicrobiae bacterium]